MATKKSSRSDAGFAPLARAAGLDKALKQFPKDVEIAAQSAASSRDAAGAIELINAEPWPPMRVRDSK